MKCSFIELDLYALWRWLSHHTYELWIFIEACLQKKKKKKKK